MRDKELKFCLVLNIGSLALFLCQVPVFHLLGIDCLFMSPFSSSKAIGGAKTVLPVKFRLQAVMPSNLFSAKPAVVKVMLTSIIRVSLYCNSFSTPQEFLIHITCVFPGTAYPLLLDTATPGVEFLNFQALIWAL